MDFIPSRMEFTPLAQTVMVFVQLPDVSSAKELLFLPAYASALSASILLLHSFFALKFVNSLLVRVGIVEERKDTVPPPGIGTGVILLFRVARLLGCLGLLALSIVPLAQEHAGFDEGLRQVVLSVPYVSFPYLYSEDRRTDTRLAVRLNFGSLLGQPQKYASSFDQTRQFRSIPCLLRLCLSGHLSSGHLCWSPGGSERRPEDVG